MIYILEFQPAFHHARFYVGYCEADRLQERIEEHNKGYGAKITRAAKAAGIHLHLVTTFPGDRKLERLIKRQKCTPKLVARIRRDGSYGECPL
jgi:predicted GIY-YIG superfamily endonuclease